jgi:glycosyltransferase involved in cell wall biosynthesis
MKIGRAGGIEQATQELLAALSSHDQASHYSLLLPRAAYHELDLAPTFRHSVAFSDRPALRLHGDNWRTAAANADLVHSLVGVIQPDLLDLPSILTVSDLLHLHHPEFFSAEDLRRRAATYEPSIRTARHIICVSEFTRLDVHRRFSVPLEKLSVVGNIPGAHCRTPPPAHCSAAIRARLGLVGPFVFYPAHPWPHKNHFRLLEAWALLAPALPHGHRLVLTGKPFPPDHPATPLLARLVSQGLAIHLGYRSRLEMQVLLHGCSALVFPSLFEGFGMPVAEALVAGKPVACSAVASLPEIAGPAAAYFDPLRPDDIARVVLSLLTDPDQRRHLAAAADRRECFAPSNIARATLTAYHVALGQPAPAPPAPPATSERSSSARRELARHHARLAEHHFLKRQPFRVLFHALRTALISPSLFWQRLVLALGETIAAALLPPRRS